MSADARRIAGYCAAVLAAGAGLLALWALLTGGFRFHAFGIPISARGEHRAALFAAVLAAVALVLLDTERRTLRFAVQRLQRGASLARNLASKLRPLLPAVALVTAATVTALAIAFGTRSAGGSDTFGYVSQAKLWLEGSLRVTRSELTDVPWPNGDWTFSPLAYRTSEHHALVPTYAPGLPLLMAGAELVFGSCGPFLVSPICAGLLVWLTYALGVRVSGRGAATLASLCIATSPIVLMLSVWPMSDVPATTFWTAALVLARSRRRGAAAAAGAAAGLAILIRPNLAPLAAVAMAIAAWPTDRRWRPAAARAAQFALACAPAAAFLGWLFNDLYGSPLESGYGRASGLYAWKHLATNAANYPMRLMMTQGPVPFLFLVAPLLARRRDDRAPLRWLLLAFVMGTFAAYALYEPFEEWWYLRFLLPAFPALFVLAFDAIVRLRDLGGPRFGAAAAAALTAAALYHGTAFTIERDIIRVTEGEQKYADAGRYVAARLPPNSIVLAMQHSGSVRLYSRRLTVRYDLLDPAWLDRALEYLRQHGYEPYVLLEDWEVERFRERFAGQAGAALVDAPPVASLPRGNVLLFAGAPGHGAEPAIMPPTSGCRTAQ